MRTIITCILVLLLPIFTHAETLPSFQLEWFAWQATHIVLVTEGEKIDGVVTVLESWRGDLKPGDTLNLPELAKFAPEDARQVIDPDPRPNASKNSTQVTGKRMVLFLCKTALLELDDYKRTRAKEKEWVGCGFGELKYSTTWLDNNSAYSYCQWMNPGPTIISERSSEKHFMEQLVGHLKVRKVCEDNGINLHAASDSATADQYRKFEDWYGGINLCPLAVLSQVKPNGLNEIRKMLNDESLHLFRGELVSVLAFGGGKEVAPEIARILDGETQFWKVAGPGLKPGWSEGKGMGISKNTPVGTEYLHRLEDHDAYSTFLIKVLKRLKSSEGDKAIAQFEATWKASVPDRVDPETAKRRSGNK